MKRVNIIAAAALAMLLAMAPEAHAIYKIHLKNGSVISNVYSYTKEDGQLMLRLKLGVIGVNESEVLKIEGTMEDEPPPPPEPSPFNPPSDMTSPQPSGPGVSNRQEEANMQKAGEIEAKIKRIDEELAAIKDTEEQIAAKQEDFRKVKLRIENLYWTGRKKALAAGKPETEYLQFLTTDEREWIRANFIKKRQMEPEIKDAEAQLEILKTQKAALLNDKASLEEELRKYR